MLLIQEDYRASNEGHYSSDSRVATIDALAMRLASRWAKVTRNMSSLRQMQKTPEFEQLIALGRDAVPSLLGMYRSAASGHLFLVLQTITGENPVPPNDYGDPEAIRRAWIEWGRRDASDHG